ncbi:hypothetical protein ACFL1M_03035, partial [Patescibacteria group bacterium]
GEVIKRHIQLTKKDGKAIIAIPNFLGINGLIQKIFDSENLKAHNLESMEINNLKPFLKGRGVKYSKIFYYGGLLIWLENMKDRNILMKVSFLAINILGHGIKALGFNSKLTSPYIVMVINK